MELLKMKTIIFLVVVTLSAVESQRNAADELRELLQTMMHNLDLGSLNIQLFDEQIRRMLGTLADAGVAIGGGSVNVVWNKQMGKRTSNIRRVKASGGEFEIKLGSCDVDPGTTTGDATNTPMYQILKFGLGFIDEGIIWPQYPEDLFAIFGNGEATVSNPTLKPATSCTEGQLKSDFTRGEFLKGRVNGEGMIIAQAVADACDPTKGNGVAEATGITGSGNVTASGIGYAVAFGNAVDMVKDM